ncbi:MAG: phosphopantetheine-binding protein, partial [Pseudonocardia sp.]|nr:phosphopantetheine-binding protein [Pseudonocardia sp.]
MNSTSEPTMAIKRPRVADDRAGDLTVVQSPTEALRLIERAATERERTAVRDEVVRLRTELAGVLRNLAQIDDGPDATIAVPQAGAALLMRPGPAAPPRPIAPQRPEPKRPAREPKQAPVRPPAPPASRRTPVPPARPLQPRGRAVAQPAIERPAAVPAPPMSNGIESGYAAVLSEVLGVPDVPVTSNFFDDLGADSMLMARFCAKVRSRPDLPNVAIKDIYRAPTIAELAAAGGAKVVA